MSKKDQELEKGLGKLLSTAALAGSMAMAQGGMNQSGSESLSPKSPRPVFSATELKPEKGYDKHALQDAISMVESNNGHNTEHALLTAGPDAGTKAKGNYGFTNSTIKSLIQNSPSLRNTHKNVLDFDDEQMHQLIYNEQPHLQHHLASEQIGHIARGINSNKPEHIAYAWLNGITGTQNAMKEGKDIDNHWHVKKVMDAYNQILNKQSSKKSNNDLLEVLAKKEKTPPGTHAKPSVEKSREMSFEIQKIMGEQWRRARELLNADDIMESTKPNPLKDWNVDLEDLSNSDANLFIINLIKSKL